MVIISFIILLWTIYSRTYESIMKIQKNVIKNDNKKNITKELDFPNFYL